MGEPARLKVRAVSLAEASTIVDSCKRMFKEDLRRAKLELCKRVSSTQHASNTLYWRKTFHAGSDLISCNSWWTSEAGCGGKPCTPFLHL